MKQEISAGGIVFHRDSLHFPVLLLRDMKHNWTFPKGIVDPGETFEYAAAREISEETGISQLTLIAPLRTVQYTFFRNEPIEKTVHYFVFSTASPTIPVHQIAEGITEVRWVPYAQAIRQVGYKDTNIPLLTQAYQRYKETYAAP